MPSATDDDIRSLEAAFADGMAALREVFQQEMWKLAAIADETRDPANWSYTKALQASFRVKGAPGILYSLSGFTAVAAERWVMLFQSDDPNSVPPNGTVPDGPVIYVPTKAAFSLLLPTRGVAFDRGLWVGLSTTNAVLTLDTTANMGACAVYL